MTLPRAGRLNSLGIGRPLAIAMLIAVSGVPGTGAIAPAAAATDVASHAAFSGVWRIERPVVAMRTADGKEPPLKPEAAAIYRQRTAARKGGDTSFDSTTWCASPGMPRIMGIDYPFEIVVNRKHIAFLHEWNWWARIVYLEDALVKPPGSDAPPPGPPPGAPAGAPPGPPPIEAELKEGDIPLGMGLAKGHWEGDTLVVETSDLIETSLLDSGGMPHSGQLKLTERLRLVSPDVLEDRILVDDPETFTQKWETVMTYRRQNTDIQEDVCLDRIRTGQPAVRGE